MQSWDWPLPELTRAGQRAYWCQQTSSVEMDNPKEVARALSLLSGPYAELIALEGPAGYSDPAPITKAIIGNNADQANILFLDIDPLSSSLARKQALEDYVNGAKIRQASATIENMREQIGPGNRILLLGVRTDQSFYSSQADGNGGLVSGFETIFANSKILGDGFGFNWLVYHKGEILARKTGLRILVNASEDEKGEFRHRLQESYTTVSQPYGNAMEPLLVVGLQVVGFQQGQEGFSLSHWYRSGVLCDYLETLFHPDIYTIKREDFPGWTLFAIRNRSHVPDGVVTMLNNSLGCFLPEDQTAVLYHIRFII